MLFKIRTLLRGKKAFRQGIPSVDLDTRVELDANYLEPRQQTPERGSSHVLDLDEVDRAFDHS